MGLGGTPSPAEEQDFATSLASGYAAGFIDLHLWEPNFARAAGEKPRASALARYEVDSQEWVTGLRHNAIHMDDPLSARILGLLDGSRDRRALMDAINSSISGTTVTSDRLEMILNRFGEFCLLEA